MNPIERTLSALSLPPPPPPCREDAGGGEDHGGGEQGCLTSFVSFIRDWYIIEYPVHNRSHPLVRSIGWSTERGGRTQVYARHGAVIYTVFRRWAVGRIETMSESLIV